MPNCLRCGREVQEYEMWYYGSDRVCYECYQFYLADANRKSQEEAKQCVRCMKKLPIWGGAEFKGRIYCEACYSFTVKEYKEANSCKKCGKLLERLEDKKYGPKNTLLCAKCYDMARGRFGVGSVKKDVVCRECGGRLGEGHSHEIDRDKGFTVCDSCYKNITNFFKCNICGKKLGVLKVIRPDGSTVCPECAKKEAEPRRGRPPSSVSGSS